MAANFPITITIPHACSSSSSSFFRSRRPTINSDGGVDSLVKAWMKTARPEKSETLCSYQRNRACVDFSTVKSCPFQRRTFFSLASLCVQLLMGMTSPPTMAAKERPLMAYDERRLLEQNKRIQNANGAPPDFPNFIREGFNVKVVTADNYVRCSSGLIYLDIKEGGGDFPKPGQQVVFHYAGYNESGRRIDSTYQQGAPAKIRIGFNNLVPGIEEALQTMKPGGKRRIIIPPELGPPVGPSTFFSAKQFEVFDVELLNVQDCARKTVLFYSYITCD